MKKVSHLNQFPKDGYIAQFLGKEFSDAIAEAETLNKDKYELISYFEQIPIGKSKVILVNYKLKDAKDDSLR